MLYGVMKIFIISPNLVFVEKVTAKNITKSLRNSIHSIIINFNVREHTSIIMQDKVYNRKKNIYEKLSKS